MLKAFVKGWKTVLLFRLILVSTLFSKTGMPYWQAMIGLEDLGSGC